MFAGIGTHKDTLAVGVVDAIGKAAAVVEVPNTRAGFIAVAALLALHRVRRVGIEGSGNYGRSIAAYLVPDWDPVEPVEVCEVPTAMTSRERRSHPSKGKTDPVDAVAIARITGRERSLPPVRLAVGNAADLRSLLDYRDVLVVERTSLSNRVHSDLHGLFPGYHEEVTDLTGRANLTRAAQVHVDQRVRAEVTRRRLERMIAIDAEVASLKRRIAAMVTVTGSTLTSIHRMGPLTAARFLAEVVEINRYPTRNTFAAVNGTSPIAASYGRTSRHRFNRAGTAN